MKYKFYVDDLQYINYLKKIADFGGSMISYDESSYGLYRLRNLYILKMIGTDFSAYYTTSNSKNATESVAKMGIKIILLDNGYTFLKIFDSEVLV